MLQRYPLSTRPVFRTAIMQPSQQSPHATSRRVTIDGRLHPSNSESRRGEGSHGLAWLFPSPSWAATGVQSLSRGRRGSGWGAFQLAGHGVSRTFLVHNWRLRRRAIPSCALADVFSSTSVTTITGTARLVRYPSPCESKENPSCRPSMDMGMGMRHVYDRMRQSLWTELFFFSLFGQAKGGNKVTMLSILAPFSFGELDKCALLLSYVHTVPTTTHSLSTARSWRPNRFPGALRISIF
ncbi:hypothetical protein ACQKWADRAFT_80655 [Trichoderma austrokoningii]